MFFFQGGKRGLHVYKFWWKLFQSSNIVSSLSEMYFKGSYTNVSNSGGTLLSPGEAGGSSLRRVHIQTRYFSSNVGPLKSRPDSPPPRLLQRASIYFFCLLVPGLYLLPRLLGGLLVCPQGIHADPSQMHFLSVQGSPWHQRSRCTSF